MSIATQPAGPSRLRRWLAWGNIWRLCALVMGIWTVASAGRKMVAASRKADLEKLRMRQARSEERAREAGLDAAEAHAEAVAHGEAALAHEVAANTYEQQAAVARAKVARIKQEMGL